MSQSQKGALYQALKQDGFEFDRHYRDYSIPQLQALAQDRGVTVAAPAPSAPPVPERPNELAEIRESIGGLVNVVGQLAALVVQSATPQPAPANPQPATRAAVQPEPQIRAARPQPKEPVLDPTKHAGVTLNTHAEDEPVRVDPDGTIWYQIEVNKPGYAKPRGRRILRDYSSGTKVETIQVAGGYSESFEVPGDPANQQPVEIKVTLPSYQTGIAKVPGLPFKIHTYNGARGFDRDDVIRYYGGADLVPDTIKTVYVSSDLCYDITTTKRAIDDEYRLLVLRQEKNR